MPLPPLLPVSEINERLEMVFPEGTPNRNYVVREMAAKTVFVMLYVGAIEGAGRWVRPDQVTRMTDAQAGGHGAEEDRDEWLAASMRSEMEAIEGRWYAANTREPIRDETLAGRSGENGCCGGKGGASDDVAPASVRAGKGIRGALWSSAHGETNWYRRSTLGRRLT